MALGGFQFTSDNPVLRTHEEPHGISRDPGEGNYLTPSATEQQKREKGLRPHSPLQDISFLRLPYYSLFLSRFTITH